MSTENSGRTITAERLSQDYSVVSGEGTYYVKAGNTTGPHDVLDKEENPVTDGNGKPLKKLIMNLKAFTTDNAAKVKALFRESGGEPIAIEELNGLTLSRNIILNDGSQPDQAIPNQEVKISVSMVEGREGQVLAATGHAIPQTTKAEAFSLEEEMEEADIPDA